MSKGSLRIEITGNEEEITLDCTKTEDVEQGSAVDVIGTLIWDIMGKIETDGNFGTDLIKLLYGEEVMNE